MMTTVEPQQIRRNERRFDLGSWLALGFVITFATMCVLVIGLSLSQPSDGCLVTFGDDSIYACVGDWATPLRVGDHILAVSGVLIADRLNTLVSPTERLGGRAVTAMMPYTIKRADAVMELSVPIRQLDGRGVLRAFGAGLAAYAGSSWFMFIFIGIAVIFALAPRSRAAQLLLVVSGSGAIVTTLGWTGESIGIYFFVSALLYDGYTLITTFWGWLLLPSLLLLVLSFPRRVWPLTRWSRLVPALLYGLPLALIVAAIVTAQSAFFIVAFSLMGLSALGLFVAIVTVTIHTSLRVRDPVVRAQTAWMDLGLLAGIGVYPLLWIALTLSPTFDAIYKAIPWTDSVLAVITSLAFVVCFGIAILRYRLFDIDIIIRRTLVYSLLTLTLGAVYVLIVIALQALFRQLTGQTSTLAVVASTLVIAALFGPLRHRVQNVIDRRFYRKKYDARQVLEAFALRAQSEADLDALADDLIGVVQDTLEPEHVRLWLKQ